MGQRSSTEQPTTIWYLGHSSGRGPTVASRNRYSSGLDQTNSSDYRKIDYRTDNVPDRTRHRRSVVSRDRSKSTDRPSRLDGQGFRIPLRNSSPINRSPSLSSPSRRKHRLEKKKRIRHSSSSVSSISSSSSSSRYRSRRYKKGHHRLRSVSQHCGHRHSRKRRRLPSSSSDRRSKKSYNEKAGVKSVSPIRHSL